MPVPSSSERPVRDDIGRTADAVQHELARRATRLRFQAPLEALYQEWQAEGSRGARIALAVVVIALLAINTANEFILSLIHLSEPTRQAENPYARFCGKKKMCRYT